VIRRMIVGVPEYGSRREATRQSDCSPDCAFPLTPGDGDGIMSLRPRSTCGGARVAS